MPSDCAACAVYLWLGWSVLVGLYNFVAVLTQLASPRGVLTLPLVPTLTLVLGHHDVLHGKHSEIVCDYMICYMMNYSHSMRCTAIQCKKS